MTLSYHPTHARRLSQQSFTPPSLFYSPTSLSIHTDFPSSSAPASSFPAIADGRSAGTVDALFGEWISEVERERIIASWRGVLARGKRLFLLFWLVDLELNALMVMTVDIMETKVVTVNADTSVEEACDVRLFLRVHTPLLLRVLTVRSGRCYYQKASNVSSSSILPILHHPPVHLPHHQHTLPNPLQLNPPPHLG